MTMMARLAALPRPALPRLLRRGHRAAPRPAAIGSYKHDSWFRRHRALCFLALGGFAFVYGFAWAIFSQVLLVPLTTPLLALAAIALWVAPDVERVPTHALTVSLTLYLFALLCWPDYIALSLPGLPWITAVRLTGIPMTVLLLVCVALSAGFRARIRELMTGSPWICWLAIAFFVIAFLSIGLSKDKTASLGRFVVAMLYWAVPFFAAIHYFAESGRVRRFSQYLWVIALWVCAIGLIEAHLHRLPWAGHIPSFLRIEDDRIDRVLAGIARAASGIYRVQSKFGVSLGLGEFLGLATPFILHLIVTSRRTLTWVAGGATLLLVTYITLKTDSRLAFIILLASFAIYLLFWATLRWKRDRASLIAPSILFAYPAAVTAFIVLSFVWRRAERMVWGTGAAQNSTDARKQMYEQGIPIVLHNPIGHGIGQSAVTLDYRLFSGELTIDTYYLVIALDFGVIGFIVYYGMFVLAGVLATRTALATRKPEVSFLIPCAIAMFNFIVSKSVFSQQENHSLVFMILGLVVVLLWREQHENTPSRLPLKNQMG